MKFNSNSIHARLYKWFYVDNYLPKNLCPYFWKLVLAFTLCIPCFILGMPLVVIGKVVGDDPDLPRFIHSLVGAILYGALWIAGGIIYIEYHWIKCLINSYSYNNEYATIAGILNIALVGIVLFLLIRKWIINRRSHEEEKEETPSIIVEFVKAKYNRYCPKIDWVAAKNDK